MGTSKRKLPAASKAVVKHKRLRVPQNGSLEGLSAKLPVPKSQSKHHSYFEFVENKEKKKKLHFQVTAALQIPQDLYPLTWFSILPTALLHAAMNSSQWATRS